MAELNPRVRLRLIARSLYLQVLLNFRTMQGPGYLFVLWPWIRKGENLANRARLLGGFLNSHPVFSSFALGAILKRIRDGDVEANATEFDKWRESLSSPLGMVGDSLIWERWKPGVFALGAALLLFTQNASIWPLAAVGSLMIYNAPLFALRYWALGESFRLGREVLALSAHTELPMLRRMLTLGCGAIAGMILGAALVRGASGMLPFIQFALAFSAVLLGHRFRWPTSISLLLALLLAVGVSAIFESTSIFS